MRQHDAVQQQQRQLLLKRRPPDHSLQAQGGEMLRPGRWEQLGLGGRQKEGRSALRQAARRRFSFEGLLQLLQKRWRHPRRRRRLQSS